MASRGRSILLRLTADTSDSERGLDKTKKDLRGLDGFSADARVDIKDEAARAKIAKLNAQLERLGHQTQTPDVKIRTAGALRSLERVERELDVIHGKAARGAGIGGGGALAAVGGKGGAAAAAAGAGALGLGVILKGSVKAAIEAETSQKKLETQLRASGLAYADYSKQIDKSIQATSKLAGLDDEDLQDAFTNIIRVTGDVTSALRLTALAADLARAKNLDVAKAGQLVGKVAAGQVTSLNRYGASVEKGATVTEALATIQRKFAGQAQAYGETTQGAIDRLSVAIENQQEVIGQGFAPTLRRLIGTLLRSPKAIASFTDALGKPRTYLNLLRGSIKLTADSLVHNFAKSWRVVKGIFVDGLNAVIRTINSATSKLNSLDVAGVIPNIPKIHEIGEATGVKIKKRGPSSGNAGGDPAGRFGSRLAPNVTVQVSTPGGGSPDPRVLADQLGREIRRRGG